jgi:hypothetical protein
MGSVEFVSGEDKDESDAYSSGVGERVFLIDRFEISGIFKLN